MQGSIKKLVFDKGFGFITPDDGSKDVFFHLSGLGDGIDFDSLNEGDRVSFTVVQGQRGDKAEGVALVGGDAGAESYDEEMAA